MNGLQRSQANMKIAKLLLSPEGNPMNEEAITAQAAYHAQQGMEKLLKYVMALKGLPCTRMQKLDECLSILENQGVFIENELKEKAIAISLWENQSKYDEGFVVSSKEVELACELYERLCVRLVDNPIVRDAQSMAGSENPPIPQSTVRANITLEPQREEQDQVPPVPDKGEMIAYVDGSYNVETKEFSFGVVAFVEEEEIHLSEKSSDAELATMRNVAGEIKGSEAAMRLAMEKGCDKITIYHDYEGIAKWCLGLWKTNKEGTIAYKRFYDGIKGRLEVRFVKVKGHSNDKYNDLADKLAKKAVFYAKAK